MNEKHFDIVIIGSGAGGGVVASELATLCQDGAKIAVLEWGPRLPAEAFTGRELEMVDKLYFHGGGMFTRDGAITIAYGKGYGGSTVVYTGTSLEIEEETVAAWNVDGVTHPDLMARSKKYRMQNNVHLLEPELTNENNRLFLEGCRKLGYEVEQFPVNVKGCMGSGLCNLGCPHDAKQGTRAVQLPRAESLGVEVVTHCKVERLKDRECLATVRYDGVGLPSRWRDGQYRVKAPVVVVCGNALNSAALLQRSNLPVCLPALGRYLTLHPALVLMARHDRPITNFYGHPKSYYCKQFAHARGFMLETCMYFPFMAAKSMVGFGAEHAEMMSRMDRLQMILSLAIDAPLRRNRVRIDRSGEPVVDYVLTPQVLESLRGSMIESARIFFAGGARQVHVPAGDRFFLEPADLHDLEARIPMRLVKPGRISIASAHLMGGCRMGRDPKTSVTDEWGQVHGLEWLFIADSSLFPSCSVVNPYLTVMALADRVAERVRSSMTTKPTAAL